MFTSDTKDKTAETGRDDHLKTGIRYLTASLLIAAAAAVYGLFSHGVYSYFMTYAFMVPLLGGAMPHLLTAKKEASVEESCDGFESAPLAKSNKKRSPLGWILEEKDLQLAVIATLTAGSLLKGALDIYGTTNKLLIAYPVIAALLIAGTLLVRSRKKEDPVCA